MKSQQRVFTPQVVAAYLFLVVIVPLLPLLISGRWGWWQAWAYAAICILGFPISRLLAWRRHPDIIAERARMLRQEDTKPWDRVLAPLVVLTISMMPPVAGLDARFGWSPGFGTPLNIFALVIFLAGYIFGTSALVENRFFSAVVRPQSERGQYVVTSGPYRWVRHPGYSGALWSNIVVPLLLDSAWAFVPAAIFAIALVVRTDLEDKTLQAELPGYRDYAGRVRCRLLPGVW